MENDILDTLEDLGYPGSSLNEETLKEYVSIGPSSVEFTKIVEWLTKELQILLNLEEQVNAISDPDDSSSFLLELSAFLREIGCPYKCLTEGGTNQKLHSTDNRHTLLLYLGTELQAARMLELQKSSESRMKVEMKESPTANCLKEMLVALSVSKPPATVTPKVLFDKVETQIQEVEQQHKIPGGLKNLVGKPLFFGVLSSKQWESLEALQQQMRKEYTVRKDLLLKRLDVTIQSFKWGDRLKKKTDDIARTYDPKRRNMIAEPKVQIAHVLAAREDIAIIEKTSCGSVMKNTQCGVKKVMIGRVPDRGGRPEDQRPPPPEMPSWQKRTEPTRGGGGGGNFGGGHGRGGGKRSWPSHDYNKRNRLY